MGVVEVSSLSYSIPGGRVLFEDASFRVGDGAHVALIGANGAGKTTLLRLIARLDHPKAGFFHVDGRIGLMQQFIGTFGASTTVRDFLLSLSPRSVQDASAALRQTEKVIHGPHGASAQMRYADALAAWGEVGGYEHEVLWDTCCTSALRLPLDAAGQRSLTTLSGGEQKRLALEFLFRSEADILLLDEPDNFLDIAGKRWLEATMNGSPKTILFVSHDRALIAATANRIVTLEGRGTWTHVGSFESYLEARSSRIARIEEERRRYRQEHDRLQAAMKEFKRRAAMNDKFASKARSMEKRIEKFEKTRGPRAQPEDQDIRVRLGGDRTGKIALQVRELFLPGLVEPFSTEIFFGERVAVLGPNGTGKSHFLKLLGGETIAHGGEWRLGARVKPSLFSQLHEKPELAEAPIVDVLRGKGMDHSSAMAGLRRYELSDVSTNPFPLLSGGQQARFQLLLIECEKPTMLLLDEPTDNLDVDSAEALEEGLIDYTGTVIAATHDRWFMQLFDRFLLFDLNGSVEETLKPPYV
jgi:ATPase subunit of ABC transporter with duplicated ATPase domains